MTDTETTPESAAVATVAKPRKSKARRIIFWSITLLIIGMAAFLLSPTPAPQPYEEKVSQGEFMEKFLGEKDNAFFDYLYAARSIDESRMNSKSDPAGELNSEFSKLVSHPGQAVAVSSGLIDYVGDNLAAIDLVRQAVKKNATSGPEVATFVDRLPYLARFRQLGRLIVLEGKIKEQNGDLTGALNDYFTVLRFSQSVLPSRGGLIHGLVGIAIDNMTFDAIGGVLPKLNSDDLKRVVIELAEIERRFASLRSVLDVEIKVGLEGLNYLLASRGNTAVISTLFSSANNQDRHSCYLDSIPAYVLNNAMWLWFNLERPLLYSNVDDMRTRISELAESPYGSEQEQRLEQDLTNQSRIERLMYYPIYEFFPALARAKEAFANHYAFCRGVRLRAATILFSQINGALPLTLDDLVKAGLINEIPLDPFCNEPFRYVNGKIYSVGHDRIDGCAEINVREMDKRGNSSYRRDGDIVF